MLFALSAFGRTTRFSLVSRSWLAARTASVFTSRSSISCATAHLSFGSQVTSDGQQTQTDAIRNGDPLTLLVIHTCVGTRKQTASVGVQPGRPRAYTIGEMIIGCYQRTWPNQALHRTAICAWGFALGFLVFVRQFVAVGELGSLGRFARPLRTAASHA